MQPLGLQKHDISYHVTGQEEWLLKYRCYCGMRQTMIRVPWQPLSLLPSSQRTASLPSSRSASSSRCLHPGPWHLDIFT